MNLLNSSTEEAFQSSIGQRAIKHKGKTTWVDFVEKVIEVSKVKGYTISPRNRENLGLSKEYSLPTFKLEVQTKKNMVDNSKRAFDAKVAKKYFEKFQNATKRGIDFDLSFTDMKRLLKETHCYYTGVELVDDRDSPLRLSLERVDENIGYTKENTKAVTLAANKWKGLVLDHGGSLECNLTVDQIKMLLEKL